MKKWVFVSIGLFICQTSWALSIEDVQKRLSAQPVMKTQFEQNRQIKGMSKPLISKGSLIISQEKGLWWHQKTPFELTLLLTDSVMKQKTANQPPQIITASQNPQLFQFNSLLSALFKADRNALEKNFTIKFTDKGNNRWGISLTPKAAPLNKIFKKIKLSGQNFLENVLIHDLQGDQTSLRFFNHHTNALTADEQKKFTF